WCFWKIRNLDEATKLSSLLIFERSSLIDSHMPFRCNPAILPRYLMDFVIGVFGTLFPCMRRVVELSSILRSWPFGRLAEYVVLEVLSWSPVRSIKLQTASWSFRKYRLLKQTIARSSAINRWLCK